jgi:hypothetical protein
VLPVENVVLITAFERRSKKIRKQALLEFTIREDCFQGVFMISPQLTNEVIIDCQLMEEYGIKIKFCEGTYQLQSKWKYQG